MNRWLKLLGLSALVGFAMPAMAHAQYIVQSAPVVVSPPVVQTYPAPVYAPSIGYAAPVTSYYAAPRVSYYAAPAVSYSAPVVSYSAPVVTYAAPAAVVTPAPGVYTTYTYRGYGIFRPRGYYSQTYYSPR